MTANEMANEFEVLYDKITNNDAPGYEDSEISLILNKAQERFFLKGYSGTNKLKEALEETEKSRKDFSELISNTELTTASTTQTGSLPNGTFYDLPTNFLYAIKEEVTVSSEDECINGNRIKVKPITHDEYVVNIENPFKQPYEELAWRLDYSRVTDNTDPKRHEIITDGNYTVTTYHLRYLRQLPDIVVDRTTTTNQVNCILNEITHRRLLDIAVEIALEITVDQRLQTNLLLNQTNE